VGAEAVEAVHGNPSHGDAMGKDPAHGVGMQRCIADPPGGADLAEQRPGLPFGDRLPGIERAHRAGLGVPAARQADLRPLPGLPRLMRRRSPPATTATSSTCSATSSERRSAPAKPNSSSARSRRPRALASQVATLARRIAMAGITVDGFDRLSAHALRVGFITAAYDRASATHDARLRPARRAGERKHGRDARSLMFVPRYPWESEAKPAEPPLLQGPAPPPKRRRRRPAARTDAGSRRTAAVRLARSAVHAAAATARLSRAGHGRHRG
jgi:hypothetical protein